MSHSLNTATIAQPIQPSAGKEGEARWSGAKPRNSCHRCGATAYKTLIARDDTGAMRPSGQYQCVQCKQVFRDVREWRDGIEVAIGQSDAATPTCFGLAN